jgi:hypothetical protein
MSRNRRHSSERALKALWRDTERTVRHMARDFGGGKQTGPKPLVTRAEVEAKRRELQAAGKFAGERSIAEALHVSLADVPRR